MRVALLSCSKSKLDHAAPAAELYTGQLFRLTLEWTRLNRGALAPWRPVGILSAKHGLVLPGDVLEPYDTCMDDIDEKAWGAKVVQQCADIWGLGTTYTMLCGASYSSPLRPFKGPRLPLMDDRFKAWNEERRLDGKKRGGLGVLKAKLKKENAHNAELPEIHARNYAQGLADGAPLSWLLHHPGRPSAA